MSPGQEPSRQSPAPEADRPVAGTPEPQVADTRPAGHPEAEHRVRSTRMSSVWIASILFAIVLLLLLIFILQNGQRVEISYLGLNGHLPLGVALLLSAVLGVLLVVIPGTARIVQLRITARRHRAEHVPRRQAGT